jgi:hypothetical protein
VSICDFLRVFAETFTRWQIVHCDLAEITLSLAAVASRCYVTRNNSCICNKFVNRVVFFKTINALDIDLTAFQG